MHHFFLEGKKALLSVAVLCAALYCTVWGECFRNTVPFLFPSRTIHYQWPLCEMPCTWNGYKLLHFALKYVFILFMFMHASNSLLENTTQYKHPCKHKIYACMYKIIQSYRDEYNSFLNCYVHIYIINTGKSVMKKKSSTVHKSHRRLKGMNAPR